MEWSKRQVSKEPQKPLTFDAHVMGEVPKGVEEFLAVGNTLPDSDSNGLLKIYKGAVKEMAEVGVSTYVDTKPMQELFQGMHKSISEEPDVKEAQQKAIALTKNMEKAWLNYSEAYWHKIEKYLKGTGLQFPENCGKGSEKKFLELNKGINPVGGKELLILAGILANFAPFQVKRDAVEKETT